MNIDSIKKISIVDYLQRYYRAPALVRGDEYWYPSPFRQEAKPSFRVQSTQNRWYDFGSGEHGDIIDLVRKINGCNFSRAVYILTGDSQKNLKPLDSPLPPSLPKKTMEITKTGDLENINLMKYMKSRGIPINIARTYCKEVHYTIGDRSYYAVGFQNDLGGWELRNPSFKGCLGNKNPTLISLQSSKVALFEGFIDFLSWVADKGVPSCDAIVLNSVNVLPKILPSLSKYKDIECYLDNDEAGKNAYQKIKSMHPQAIDKTDMYGEAKDYNEYLMNKNPPEYHYQKSSLRL